MEEIKPLSQPQVAAIFGVGIRRFQQIEKQVGGLTRAYAKNGRPGGYMVREFGIWLRKQYAAEMGVTDSGEIYDDKIERARLTHHQANNEALKEAVNRRELIPASEVIEAWAEMVGSMRARLLALPGRLANRAMSFESVREAEDYAREEVYSALEQLGDAGTGKK